LIKTNRLERLDNDITWYGNVWDSFQDDLSAIGCGYWAKLYADLFANKFVANEKQLERRLNVPDERKAQGAAAVAAYLERVGDDVELLDEARIIILGDKGAGKTSIARKLYDITAPMPKEEESTEGVSVLRWQLPKDQDGNSVNVHVWDFAGHTITHAAHRCFMSSRCLYIYVYNGRVEQGNDPEYWLEQIKMHGGDSNILFLINEKDNHKADIAEKALKDAYPTIIDYYRVDIGNEIDTSKLEKFRQTVIWYVRNNPSWNRQEISADAYRVKEKLYTYFEKNKTDSITRNEFNEIARKQNVSPKNFNAVLDDLHVLGICLWYKEKEMELDTYVLNPEWITTGIYKIINWGFNNSKYQFSLNDGKKIFIDEKNKLRYPPDKIQFLFSLMKIYELAYSKNNDVTKIFIPLLLPIDRPDNLPLFPYGERLTMHITVDKALPPNIVSRLIVNRHDDIGKDETNLWRKGAVLHYNTDNTIALIKEETKRCISVQVKGANKTPYIKNLRDTLENIFNAYQKIKPDFHYEILVPDGLNKKTSYMETTNSSNNELLMIRDDIIKGYLRAYRPFFDALNNLEIPLQKTNQGYALQINIDNINIGHIDHSTHITNNFHHCVINLQGEMNALAETLKSKEYFTEEKYIREIVDAIENTREIMESTPKKENTEEIIKRGLVSKIHDFYDELADNNSELHKNVSKLRNGTKKVQKILKIYNEFAKLIPVLPQIPNVLCGSEN